MVKTLYVGNLAWSAKEQELAQFFEGFAPVISARVISEPETGRSKGFGFVEVADEDAEKVVKSAHGASFNGRDLIVNEARPKAKI